MVLMLGNKDFNNYIIRCGCLFLLLVGKNLIYIALSAKFQPSKRYNSHDKLFFFCRNCPALPYN